jgi:hypothetical protein
MNKDDLKTLSVKELLQFHQSLIEELKNRKISRTKNNPVSDYAEWLVSTMMGLQLTTNSNHGFDATDTSDKRYQIKCRRVTPDNKSRQLGVIRNLEKKAFDFLIVVIFNHEYTIDCAVMMPHEVIADYASYRKHVNGHILHLRGKILQDARVLDVRDRLKT